MKNSITILTIIASFFTLSMNVFSQSNELSKELGGLVVLEKEINTELFKLLQIHKTISSNQSMGQQQVKYRIITMSCDLYMDIDQQIEVDKTLLTNDMLFEKTGEDGDLIQLRRDQQEFWINRYCLQEIIQRRSDQNIAENNITRWVELSERVYNNIEVSYDAFLKWNKKNSKKLYQFDQEVLKKIRNSIYSNKHIADQIVARIRSNESVSREEYISLKDRISVVSDIAIGESVYTTGSSDAAIDKKSNNILVNLNSSYQINSNSSIDVLINHRSDTKITPYSSWDNRVSYQSKREKFNYYVNGLFQSYKNEENSSTENMTAGLSGRITNNSRKFNYSLDLDFRSQYYKNNEDLTNDRFNSKLDLKFNSKSRSTTALTVEFLARTGNNQPFSTLRSAFIHTTNKLEKVNKFELRGETSYFSLNESNSNTRLIASYTSRVNSTEGHKVKRYALVYRDYQFQSDLNYVDFSFRLNRSSNRSNISNRTLVRMRYYHQNASQSHFDIGRSTDFNKGLFWARYNVNLRAHVPDEMSFATRLDGFASVGIDLKYVKLGPTANLNLSHDFKSGEKFSLTAPGNSVRYGLEASGQYNLNDRFSGGFRVSYTFLPEGNNTTTSDVPTPSNLQWNANLTYSFDVVELYLRADCFQYNTNDEITATQDNIKDQSILIGARYKF